MTVSVKSPTSTTGSIQLNGSDVLTIESDRSVDIDSGTLHVDATNNRVGIGTSSPSNSLHLYGSSSALRVERTGSDSAALITKTTLGHYGVGTGIGTASNCFNVYDYNASAERMRIDSSGNVLVGSTSVVGTGKFQSAKNSGYCSTMYSIGNGADYIQFWNGSEVGSIKRVGGTSVSYNTSSDYRLKENVLPMSGSIDRLKQLKPSTWSWVQDGSHGEGFLAHEAQSVVPEAVHGTKDAVDDEGNPVYQGIDQSKLVPLLTAALQEAITKIENLETRIEALEAK